MPLGGVDALARQQAALALSIAQGVTRPRIVGTNGRGNGALLSVSSTLTTTETREAVYIGNDTPYIQLAFDNWGIGVTGGDVVPPTAFTIAAVAVEISTLNAVMPVYFSGGSRSVAIPAGSTVMSMPLYATDFGLPVFKRGMLIWVRKRGSVPTNGQMFDNATVGTYSAAGPYATRFDATVGSNGTSQVDAIGAMTAKTGQATFGAGINTTAVIGAPRDSRIPAFWAQGTSIDTISNDDLANLLGGAGWIMGAMFADTSNAKPIPIVNFSRGSSSLGGGIVTGTARRNIYLAFADAVIDGHGTGDIAPDGSGDTTALKANELTVWAQFRAAGITKIIKPKVIPRNGSTDNWATLANQTQVPAFDNKAADVNAWIDTQLAAGLVDHILSQDVTRYDTGANAWKWPVNGTANWSTTEGTHPVARVHILMAAQLRALIAQQYPAAV